jgi:hypothetical protein
MKAQSLALALPLALGLATSAFAGGMSEPVMEPVMTPTIVEQQTASSADGIVVPLLLLAVIVAVVSN